MDWTRYRAAVPAVEQVIYMNTGWSGPLCSPARDAITAVFDREYEYGPMSPPVHEAALETKRNARATVARLLGVTPETVALTQSTAHAINIVFSGLAFTMGDEVITTDAEHHAMSVPAYYARRRLGLGLRIVQLDHEMSEDDFIRQFDEAISKKTRLVAISHVLFNVGTRLPVRQITDIAHSRGALVLIDGAQAVGQVPVDVRRLGVDFYTVSGHKWLLGPAGAGALYIRPDLIDQVEAIMVARQATRSFDARGHMEPRRDVIEKFDLTETSTPLWAGLIAAIQHFDAAGQPAVEARVKELGALLTTRLAGVGGVRLMCPPPGPLATGLVPFAVEGVEPDDVTEALWEGGNIVGRSVFGRKATRLSVHAFNTPDEIVRVVEFVGEVVERARYPIKWSWTKKG